MLKAIHACPVIWFESCDWVSLVNREMWLEWSVCPWIPNLDE